MSKPASSRSSVTGLPQSILECGVCLSLLCEPVSLSCGHTFCRTCLVSTLQRSTKKCPCCRAVCYTRAEDQPQNVMIAQIIKMCFPEQLERRMRETEAEKAKFELCLPAFFYNVPMFPGQTLSLHLFEPRYKLMMRRIIDTSRRFAYVPKYSTYVPSKGDTALVAEVCEAEFLSDGRVLVMTRLMGRYTVQDHFVEEGTQGLHYCQLEPVEDEVLEGADLVELEGLHARARALSNGFLAPFKSQLVQSHGEMPNNAVGLSMWMSSFLPFYVPEKHALLASTSTRERLRACLKCVASLETVAKGPSRNGDASSAPSGAHGNSAPPPPLAHPAAVSGMGAAAVGAAAPGAPAPAEAVVSMRAAGEGARG